MKIQNLENIKVINGGICAVENVKAAGSREGKYGVSVILNENSTSSAVFTSNKVTAAPINYTKEIIKKGKLSAIVANSGNANCMTGIEGLNDCKDIVQFISKKLNINSDEIAIASTGVIGRKMPMDKILDLASNSCDNLKNSPKSSTDCAEGIMTTDTHPKEFAVEVTLTSGEKVKIGGITKGTGMIAPNMGTMLSFLTTDAQMSEEDIQNSLKIAVNNSFNMIVVDGDESTNDIAILMANGKSGVNINNNGVIDPNFQKALNYLTQELAKMMVKDGEGASKFMEVTIDGAKSETDAKKAVKAIISSSLFKAALFGGDPNWGRIAMAIGYSGISFDLDIISINFASKNDSIDILKNGDILALEGTQNLLKAEEIMNENYVEIIVDLNIGDSRATGWGCDLTYDYVKINAEYTT
ncbi:bifunctional ornithine acetyltransferase/N-acetylglutamate synthase [Methanobrevibacter sp. OttesenSCG-928-I08]|nr:bifunctional ornithine acetyltransferase/N-acetylglutamate synthase [Methanobrevibacter sp. OttesenSCG-928-I08]